MRKRIIGIIEISLVFLLMVLLFRSIKALQISKTINASFNGFLFSEYATLVIAATLLYIAFCRPGSEIPFFDKLRYQWKVVARGFFPIFSLSVLLGWVNWRQWTGAFMISVAEVGLLFWFARLVSHQQPTWRKISVSGSLILLPAIALTSSKIVEVLIAIVYFYLFVAISEEVFFRGYIQTRLNSVFGRPKKFLGIQYGWGLVITSVFFGMWHLGWGSETLAWPHVVWTMFAGLIFGFVREKSESVIAPAILHGIMNYGPQAVLFYLFWN